MKSASKRTLSLKNLTKKNVWYIQENDIFRLYSEMLKDPEAMENKRHYTDIIKSAFLIEDLGEVSDIKKKKYEKQGYHIAIMSHEDNTKYMLATKKRPIVRVSDLSYENIHHITAAKLVEVLERNFGGGWDSLSQSTKDIIESGFDISTTTLPQNRLKKKGGMYEKKISDGYDVLVVPKGTWVEAIFVKSKPEIEKPHTKYDEDVPISDVEDNDDDKDVDIVDTFNKPDEDDIEPEEPTDFSDEDINEENYTTIFEEENDDTDGTALVDYVDE